MTRAGLICLLALAAGACAEQQLPDGVLSREEYASLLVDIYLAEARVSSYAVTPDSAMRIFKPYEAGLLKERGLSDSTVLITYRYYLDHPEEMELVYDTVIDTLSLREQKAAQPTP
jgi:hypothetical protein